MGRHVTSVVCCAATLVGLLCSIGASSAQAAWGPYNECNLVTKHCYSIAIHTAGYLDSIAFEDATAVNVAEWQTGSFVDWEEWIGFKTYWKVPGWIETGSTAGNGTNCCTLYPFWAQMHNGYYEEAVSPNAVPANTYVKYRISDPEQNGVWHVYFNETELAMEMGGWPSWLEEQEAGMEAASDVHPYKARGRQFVASSDEGEWMPWKGATWYHDPAMCIATNPESSAGGNISFGAGECG